MPGLPSIQYNASQQPSLTPSPESRHPENTALWLPSSLPENQRRTACIRYLPDYEEKLRTAQCYDTNQCCYIYTSNWVVAHEG